METSVAKVIGIGSSGTGITPLSRTSIGSSIVAYPAGHIRSDKLVRVDALGVVLPLISYDASMAGNYIEDLNYYNMMNDEQLDAGRSYANGVHCYSGNPDAGLLFTVTALARITVAASQLLDSILVYGPSSTTTLIPISGNTTPLEQVPLELDYNFPAGTYFISTSGGLVITECTAVAV